MNSTIGSYQILEEVGKGGMAVVYRAYQPSIDREVAIKVITQGMAHNPESIQRFQREARLIARLEHPHILPVYDFDGGHEPPYIVMRYLDSGTLDDILGQEPLPPADVLFLLRQIGSALDYAHRQGIIHRDIKPSNIMVDREGNAFVTDFGLGRMVGGSEQQQLTASGAIMGTPNYMSPEQAQGLSNIDHRTDIYALGVILFQMLSRTLPFQAESPVGVIMKHLTEPTPSILTYRPDLPPQMDNVIKRALAKAPAERYPSVAALVEALTAVMGQNSNPYHLRQAIADSTILRWQGSRTDDSRPPSEQHKMVTILYAGAMDYVELVAEEKGPAAARQAIERLWDTTTTIIQDHAGQVVSRSEENLLALWGAETSRENDVEQAIRAALALQVALREQAGDLLVGESDDYVPLNIGLHTGLTLLAPSADGSISASGATISLTNRLMQQAEGIILISCETYRQARGIFDFSEDVPLKLRRSQATIPTYRVLAAKARVFHVETRGVEGIETRLVGREAELKTLQNAYLEALEEVETQVVTLISEVGLGKSRLLYEFSNWADLRPEIFWVLRGRATPEMTARPYALLRNILTFRYEIQDNDSPITLRQKLENGLAAQIGTNDEMAHLLGYLAGFELTDSPYIQNLQGDPAQLTALARQMVKRWLRALCAVSPVVIELEDLHHADESTLALLNEFLSEAPDLPLLLIALARPSLFERWPAWGRGLPAHSQLTLTPLDKRDSRALVQEILQKAPDIPKTLRDFLVERAGGNPYYLEELVKSLIDNRVIIKESERHWRVELTRLEHVSVPTTLMGVLQTRLDSLLYPEKLTLQRAAVVGRIFYDSALLALDAADETHLTDLPAIFHSLAAREFIYVRPSSDFAGSKEYIFGEQLLRQALLDTLLPRQTETYYQASATWFVQISGQRAAEYAGLIAAYYEKGGNSQQAAHYLSQAGEQALAVCAYAQAQSDFARALALLDSAEAAALPLRLKLGQTLYHLSEYAAARSMLEAALSAAHSQNDPLSRAEGLYWLSQVAGMEGDYPQAERYLAESLGLARAEPPGQMLALVLYGLGGLQWRLGNVAGARSALEESLALARQENDHIRTLYALSALGLVAVAEGKLTEAQKFAKETLALAQRLGHRERTAAALNNLGVVTDLQGHKAAAQAYAHQTLALARELGNQHILAMALNNLVEGFIEQEDMLAARPYLHEALTVAWRIGAIPMQLMLMGTTGGMLIRQGNPERGLVLTGLALYHPAIDADSKRAIYKTLSDLKLNAEDPVIAGQLAAGQALDLETMVADLLVELGESR